MILFTTTVRENGVRGEAEGVGCAHAAEKIAASVRRGNAARVRGGCGDVRTCAGARRTGIAFVGRGTSRAALAVSLQSEASDWHGGTEPQSADGFSFEIREVENSETIH